MGTGQTPEPQNARRGSSDSNRSRHSCPRRWCTHRQKESMAWCSNLRLSNATPYSSQRKLAPRSVYRRGIRPKNGESERATIAGSERRGGAKATPDSQLTQSFYLNLKRPKYPSVNQLNDSTPDHKLYIRLWSGVFRDIGSKALAVFSAPSLSTKVVRKRLSARSDGYP